jgi:IclR family acetate operon transcriptional repressor
LTGGLAGRFVQRKKKKGGVGGAIVDEHGTGAPLNVHQARAQRAPGARPAGERHGIQSVDRAITLLEVIADAGGEATLTEIAARAELNISTSHHLLSTLVRRGYVAKVPGRRSYALGGRILELGYACLRQIDLPRRAEPFIARLSEATGEAVHLVTLKGETMVTLARREARTMSGPGTMIRPDGAHAKASGKAILAWLPEHEAKRVTTAQGMIKFTPNTITEWPALNEDLRFVRRNSYSMDREEYQSGYICFGAAVRDYQGAVIASISASTPLVRATEEHLKLMRDEVVDAANSLSAELAEPAMPALPLVRPAAE